MRDVLGFAADRIQEQERLPEISEELAEQIRMVGGAMTQASEEIIKGVALNEFLSLLEGVPAAHSLQVVIDMMNSPHGAIVRDSILATRAALTRVEYYEKLQALAELFTPVRVARITETAHYIEAGWGWRRV